MELVDTLSPADWDDSGSICVARRKQTLLPPPLQPHVSFGPGTSNHHLKALQWAACGVVQGWSLHRRVAPLNPYKESRQITQAGLNRVVRRTSPCVDVESL